MVDDDDDDGGGGESSSSADAGTTTMRGRAELGNDSIRKRAEGVMDRMDAMVLDDVLRKLTRAGVELSMGALGGIVLYSVPDEMFVGSFADDARSARRRLIRAADPSLERMLFRPGGVWDVLPRNLTEILTNWRLKGHVGAEANMSHIVVRRQEGKEKALAGSVERTGGDDLTYDGDDSLDSPMVSRVPSVSSHDDEPQTNSSVDARAKISRQNDDEGSREDVEGELCATTINSIVVHNFMGTGCLDGELRTQQYMEKEEEPISPRPDLQLRQILHRTSIAAALLFLCHLCRSSSTRRAWGSAVNLLASLGLASTAIGAGVVSALLSSNKITAIHPILEVLDRKILERSAASRAHTFVDRMIKRVCDEIKKNKRLHSALAFFVLYRIRSLTRKRGRHSCNSPQQVGIK
ncbi:hypothetical protein ACHAW5_010191 [Stephanodiscus triporus]|uniref:Uncharacterized protein n=1 Tax=Stephanodiscus triporus TaxID=2934178 RepID=A0ABD3PQB1_9STRA